MDTYERRIYTFLLTLLRQPALAEDCAQDTFLRAYENLRKGKPVNAAWLFKVARNRALDELSARSRVRTDQEGLEQIASPADFVSNTDVWEALWLLPVNDREVLYLFVVAGFKTDEIAKMIHTSGNAVRQRLYRARQRFRALYTP